MFKGVNKVFILGTLGSDPEIRYTSNGNAVTNISVATSDVRKNKISGDFESKTEWHKIVLYDKLAETSNNQLKKGSKIYIEGVLRTNKWRNKDGVLKNITEIIANNIQILDFKNQKTEWIKPIDNYDDPVLNKDKLGFFDENIPF